MKLYGSVFLLLMSVFSCSKNEAAVQADENSILGEWKEFEAYADPGDGSATFQPVDGFVLNIKEDSSYSCIPANYLWGSIGKISLLNDSVITVKRIAGSNWGPGNSNIFFKLQGNILELQYGCIEGCGSRLKRPSGIMP